MNALRALGRRITERSAITLANTSPALGTSSEGILGAFRALGYDASSVDLKLRKDAWAWVTRNLNVGKPIILCVDDWQHWVTAIGMVGDRVILVDSTNTKINKSENGIWVLSKREFMTKWRHSRKGVYSGIVIGRK